MHAFVLNEHSFFALKAASFLNVNVFFLSWNVAYLYHFPLYDFQPVFSIRANIEKKSFFLISINASR